MKPSKKQYNFRWNYYNANKNFIYLLIIIIYSTCTTNGNNNHATERKTNLCVYKYIDDFTFDFRARDVNENLRVFRMSDPFVVNTLMEFLFMWILYICWHVNANRINYRLLNIIIDIDRNNIIIEIIINIGRQHRRSCSPQILTHCLY